MGMLSRVIPREYIDRVLSAKTEDFSFNASVETDKGKVKLTPEELKGKKLTGDVDPIYKLLSRGYSRLLNRLARVKGIDAKFKAFIVPTDAIETIETGYGQFEIGLAVAEVVRETPSGRRRTFQYGTIVSDGKVAYFNPFGTIDKRGIENVIALLNSKGAITHPNGSIIPVGRGAIRDYFPIGREHSGEALLFIVLKLLGFNDWASHFNFPVAYAKKHSTEVYGYGFARPNQYKYLSQSLFFNIGEAEHPLSMIETIEHSQDYVEVSKTQEGFKVARYPSILVGGTFNPLARIYLSRKNPDIAWFGTVLKEKLKNPSDKTAIMSGAVSIVVSDEDVAFRSMPLFYYGEDGSLNYNCLSPNSIGKKLNIIVSVQGDNPLKDKVSVKNALVPGIVITTYTPINERKVGIGVIMPELKFAGKEGVATAYVVIVSEEGRLAVRKVKVSGRILMLKSTLPSENIRIVQV